MNKCESCLKNLVHTCRNGYKYDPFLCRGDYSRILDIYLHEELHELQGNTDKVNRDALQR